MNLKSLSQQETLTSYQGSMAYTINKLEKDNLRIEDIGDYIPGCVMVQDLHTMTNTYMNTAGCGVLRMSSEELFNLGPSYFSRFFPAEETEHLCPQLQQFIQHSSQGDIYSFFQRVRPNDHSDYHWYFTTSRLYPSHAPDHIGKIMHIAVEVNCLSYMGKKISNLYDDDTYNRQNFKKLCMLSKREKQIITLIYRGTSSYEISNILYISIHTVNNHRKNILWKLEMKNISELIKFAIAFNLV